jgi:hypothetical protein
MLEFFSLIAHIATAFGVMVAARQLALSKRHAMTSFEDSLAKEYRDIAATLPVKALLGETLSEAEQSDKFDEFYRYFDLCNQQIFLYEDGRVSEKTWQFWKNGIASNIKRPAFAKAWMEIARRSNEDFSKLSSLFPPEQAGRNG